MTMTTFQVCSSWASTYMVASDSNSEVFYMVKFFAREKAVCSCPAYRFSGEYDDQTCKHIKKVTDHGCFIWDPDKHRFIIPGTKGSTQRLVDNGIMLFSTTKKNTIDRDCPQCGLQLMETTI